MSHTVSVFGLDAEGRTRVLIDYEAGVDAVVKEIRALLAVATGSPAPATIHRTPQVASRHHTGIRRWSMTRPLFRVSALPRLAARALVAGVLAWGSVAAFAQDTPVVDKAAAQAEAQVLFREVMSPFCPGLTLADCPSPNAFDLRNDIQARLERGESRESIVDALVGQYGTQLLSDPSDTPIGRVLWGVPILLSVLAAGGLAVFLRRVTRGQHAEGAATAAEPAAIRERLDEELAALD